MRVAIWAAVSTASQAAEDKASIPVQVEAGKNFIAQNGHSLAGQYIVPGESRTAFISLSHAERDIPQLKQLLDDASAGRFEALFLYDLNRLRNLMLPVFESLAGYGVQIYNHDDPDALVPQEHYTPELINARRLKIKLHDIISGQEVNTLQKHYREKMPKRITERKLHAGLGLPPYGYRKPAGEKYNRNAVLEIVPEEARVLRQMKDWFLRDGLSLTAIADRLNQQGVASSRGGRWWYSVVRYLLANPFYAGVVSFGTTKRQRDRRLVTVKRVRGENVVANKGIHEPLWDEVTHDRILHELARRASAQPGISTRAFTRLLYCECGAVLWAQKTPAGNYWRCSTMAKGHTYINDLKVFELVVPELVHSIKNHGTIKLPKPKDETPNIQREIRELKTRQKRLLDLYEDGNIDKNELNRRMADIKDRLTHTEGLLARTEQESTRRLALKDNLAALKTSIDRLPDYIRTADPSRVNASLHSILKGVKITKEKHKITLLWNV